MLSAASRSAASQLFSYTCKRRFSVCKRTNRRFSHRAAAIAPITNPMINTKNLFIRTLSVKFDKHSEKREQKNIAYRNSIEYDAHCYAQSENAKLTVVWVGDCMYNRQFP